MPISTRTTTIFLALLFGIASLLLLQAGAWGKSDEAPPAEVPVEVENGTAFAAERLIVTYESDASEATEDRAVEEVSGEVEDEIEPIDVEVIELPSAENARPGEARKDALQRAKEKLVAERGVASVEYDYVRKASYDPIDPAFKAGKQYGLTKPRFPEAWGGTAADGVDEGRGVRLAIVDSGIDDTHPDLKSKILYQRDFAYDDARAEDEKSGHGSHVAGIASATTNNDRGMAGACPRCKLLVAKVLNNEGIGFDSDVADGIVWSAESGAKVINLSLGGPQANVVLKRAVDYAHARGVVVVAAAGNSAQNGNPIEYPAAYSNVIAVAATDQNDKRAPFSNFGDYVDVAAPGVQVHSTVPGGYRSYSGTSMASPHVAALAGLAAGKFKDESNTQIRNRILYRADDLGEEGRDPNYGKGRIDAKKTLLQ